MDGYLDWNATAPLRPEARATWLAVVDELAGNPSSPHAAGRRARHRIDEARERVAAVLGLQEEEIVFTSGGTESNNLALFGVLAACGRPPERAGLVTTAVEHSAVLGPARALAARGHPLAIVPVDRAGRPDPGAVVAAARRPGTALVAVQAANNELGGAPDLAAIGQGLEALGPGRPRFHTDAVQALGRLPVDLAGWGVDLAAFSAHKVGGPVGVGVLVRRAGVQLEPIFHGGGQEGGLRPGTEDAAGIAAAAVAIELAVREQAAFARHTAALARSLWDALAARLPGVELLGPSLDDPRRLPNTLDVRVPNADGPALVARLDLAGIAVSAGSACASGSLEPSHVLRAIGRDDDDARSGLRLSLGWSTTDADCKRAVDILCKDIRPSRAR